MKKSFKYRNLYRGFTLIELLVVISIIGVLIGISVFGLAGARESARDAKRKSDLELVRAGLEIYKSDCNGYPVVDITTQTSLIGSGQILNCPVTNTYISQMPTDPQSPRLKYLYSGTTTTYEICASLEQGGVTVTCGGSSNCGAAPCNYKLTNP